MGALLNPLLALLNRDLIQRVYTVVYILKGPPNPTPYSRGVNLIQEPDRPKSVFIVLFTLGGGGGGGGEVG